MCARAYRFPLASASEVGDVVMRALESGGTASGEHGVGLGKLKYLQREHGNGVEVMQSLKLALDPHAIMNPGKLGAPVAAS